MGPVTSTFCHYSDCALFNTIYCLILEINVEFWRIKLPCFALYYKYREFYLLFQNIRLWLRYTYFSIEVVFKSIYYKPSIGNFKHHYKWKIFLIVFVSLQLRGSLFSSSFQVLFGVSIVDFEQVNPG